MKKTFAAIVAIIIVSVCRGAAWERIDKALMLRNYGFKYEEYVERYSAEYSVPQEVIYAVIKCESDFVPDAVSPKGAVGLMQMMPETYDWLCTKLGETRDSLYNPETSIKYGTYYLSYLWDRFGIWENCFAAYNAGDTKVSSWLENAEYAEDGRLTYIPYEETRKYVKKVNDAVEAYKELLY